LSSALVITASRMNPLMESPDQSPDRGSNQPTAANQTQAPRVPLVDPVEHYVHNYLDQAARRRLHLAVHGNEPAYRAALRQVAVLLGVPDVYDADMWDRDVYTSARVTEVLDLVLRTTRVFVPPTLPLQSFLGSYPATERFVYLVESVAAECMSFTVHGRQRSQHDPAMFRQAPFLNNGAVLPLGNLHTLQRSLLRQWFDWAPETAETAEAQNQLRGICLDVLQECGEGHDSYLNSTVHAVFQGLFAHLPEVPITTASIDLHAYPWLRMRSSFDALAAAPDVAFGVMAMPQLVACTMLMISAVDQYHLGDCFYGMRLRLATDSLQLLERLFQGTENEQAAAIAAAAAAAMAGVVPPVAPLPPVLTTDRARIRELEATVDTYERRIRRYTRRLDRANGLVTRLHARLVEQQQPLDASSAGSEHSE